MICLCTKCYPDVKTEEKRKTLGWKPQYQQQGKAGVTPYQEGKFSLGNSWLRKGRWGMSQCFGKWIGVCLYFNSLITLPQILDSVAVVQFCFSTKIDETVCVQEFSSLVLVVCIALYVLQSAKHSGILLAFSTLNISLGVTKSSDVLKVRQSWNCNFFPASMSKKWVLKLSRVSLGS